MSTSNVAFAALLGLGIMGSSLLVPAQDPTRMLDPWREAKVAANFEHDLNKAATIYRTIAEDAQKKRLQQERARALLELGRVLRLAGLTDEAIKALRDAAKGKGKSAQEAERLLQIGSQDPDLLKAKVEKLIKQLAGPAGPSRAKGDLLWIGHPAVPFLTDAADKEKSDLRFIELITTVIVEIGGDAANKWLVRAATYDDVLKRRAVVKGIKGVMWKASKASPAALATFLKDKDVAVRRDAIVAVGHKVNAGDIIALLADPKPAVRDTACHFIQRNFRSMRFGDQRDALLMQVIQIFDKAGWPIQPEGARFDPGAITQVGPEGMSMMGSLKDGLWFSDTRSGWIHFLKALRYDVLRNESLHVNQARGQRAGPTGAELPELLATARKLGSASNRPTKTGGYYARNSLAGFVRRMLEPWGHRALPTILELANLNYGWAFNLGFEEWITRHGKVTDMPEIAKVLSGMRKPDVVLSWMAKHTVPSAALTPMKRFPAWLDKNERALRNRGRGVRRKFCNAIAAVQTADAEKYLVSFIRKAPKDETQQAWYDAAVQAIMEKRDAQTERIFCELIQIPGDGTHEKNVRWSAVHVLAETQSKKAIPLYAKAYQLGYAPTNKRSYTHTLEGQRLRRDSALRAVIDHRHGNGAYSDEELARIFDSCLATGKVMAFADTTYVVLNTRNFRLPDAVAKVIADRALACPDRAPVANHRQFRLRRLLTFRLLDRHPTGPSNLELIKRALKDPDLRLRGLVMGVLGNHIGNKDVIEQLRQQLHTKDPANVGYAASLLSGCSPETLIGEREHVLATNNSQARYFLARAVLQKDGAKAIDTVGKLILPAAKMAANYRVTLVNAISKFRDMRAVPYVLEALKDESDSVRNAAEKQLKSIRFYNDQKRLWNRLMEGGDISAGSAAEALVQQASRGKTLDIRLTAIQSLGTLGKPETLPFLIKLMSDEDAGIRKAAKAAADRINSKVKTGANK